jgi:hypothetical protein
MHYGRNLAQIDQREWHRDILLDHLHRATIDNVKARP